jgi:lysophospholipase L1-like esterase
MRIPSFLFSLCAALPALAAFEFREGDRVALLGNTVIERDQRYGSIESTLTVAAGPKSVTFRNLAWSADTVQGHSRSYFGPPKDGLERLKAHLTLVKPTVVLACYGSELAFEEDFARRLPEFLNAHRAWLDLVNAAAPGVRVVLVTAPPLENLPAPFPNQDAANANLITVNAALAALAKERGLGFADPHAVLVAAKPAAPRTFNGVHMAQAGHDEYAAALAQSLGLTSRPVDPRLREYVVKKDELFFHRFRPANETYLFLFRKHEQGRNAAEMPQFDPLVAEGDKQIHQLKLELLGKSGGRL